MGKFTKPASEFLDTELMNRHLQLAGDFVWRHARVRFIETSDRMLRSASLLSFDSPLEALFWLWFGAITVHHDYYPYNLIGLEAQPTIIVNGETFRPDFAVVISEPQWSKAVDAGLMTLPKILVELDGHEFHERTREQVERRDRRDRAFQQDGWRVFHFSYGEFTTKPDVCITEVFDVVSDIAVDLYRQYSLDVPTEFHNEYKP